MTLLDYYFIAIQRKPNVLLSTFLHNWTYSLHICKLLTSDTMTRPLRSLSRDTLPCFAAAARP